MPVIDLDVPISATASITADRLRGHVEYLADDAREGRGAGTKGLEAAATFLAEQLADAGLAGAFDGAYYQSFDMPVRVSVGQPTTLATKPGGPLQLDTDFAPFGFSGNGAVTGPAVFAGYGVQAEAHDYDDYADIDAAGKVLVIFSGEPGDDDPNSPFDGKRATKHAALRRKVLVAREAKAAAVLIIGAHLKSMSDRRGGPSSDAGIIAHQITAAAAAQILGFDPAPLKAKIDRTYEPAMPQACSRMPQACSRMPHACLRMPQACLRQVSSRKRCSRDLPLVRLTTKPPASITSARI